MIAPHSHFVTRPPEMAAEAQPDFNWVRPDLAIGSRVGAEGVAWLSRVHRVRRIVDVRAEACDNLDLLLDHGMALLHLPTPDHHAMTMQMLWTGVRWIEEGLLRGQRVLVHCENGIGRSALLTCCVLVHIGHDPREAMQLAKSARPKILPSPAQLEALLEWSGACYEKRGGTCPRMTWQDLAEIAYQIPGRPGEPAVA